MRASSEILEIVLDSSNDHLILIDAQFRVIFVNEVTRKVLFSFFNKTINKGDDYRDFIFEDLKVFFEDSFQRAVNGETYSVELETKAFGFSRWFYYTINPVYRKDKRLFGVKVTAVDITEKKLSEIKVREMNMQLMAVLNTTSDSVIFLDKDCKIILFNNVAKERIINNIKLDLEVGEDFKKYLYTGGEEKFREDFTTALNGVKFTQEYNYQVYDKNIWFRSTFAPVYQSDGSLFGVSIFASNIDEQKRAEIALKESEEKFRKIVESAANPIIIVNTEMKIQMINSEVESVFGYTKDELIGSSISKLIPERFKVGHTRYQKDYLKSNEPIRMGVNRHTPARKKNGEEITIEASLNTFEINGERFVLLIIQDITHRLVSEKNLIKTNQELQLLNRINDLTLVINDKEQLLNEVCRELVQTSEYKLAWVCRKNDIQDSTGNITPIALFGETDYVNELKISLNDSWQSRGPTATALRFEKTVITNNINESDDFKPWLDLAKKYGISSSLVLPIRFDRNTVGCINIYSERIDAFDTKELSLLERMARNISLTLCNISLNDEKEIANLQLNKRIKELKTIYQVNALLQNEELDLEALFSKIVQVLPKGFQHADICDARIEFDHSHWQTKNYQASKYKLKANFETIDKHFFKIEVVYNENNISSRDAVFLREEYDLIYAVKEMVKVYYNKSVVAKQLQVSESNLHSVFENTSVGHLLMDVDLNIQAYNNVFSERYFNFTNVKIDIGANFIELLQEGKQHQVNSAIEKVKRLKKPISYETVYSENGEQKHFTININPVLENDILSGYSMSAVDITDLKKIESERQHIINNLILRNRDLEQFAYIVSHNLRAPLVNILGIAAFFSEGNVNEDDFKINISNIQKSANHLDNVVHDLNDILNIRNTGREKWQNIDLLNLINEVKHSIEEEFHNQHVIINTNFASVSQLHAVKAYMHSVFYNLISNSIKYARENVVPRIDIWTEIDNNSMIIHFSDNGMGIDTKRYKDQIFGLYKRFDLNKSGKGMGLFLVKSQVEAMDGTIEISSNLGEGTKFKLVFPLNGDS